MSEGKIKLPPVTKKPAQNLVACKFFPVKYKQIQEAPVMCSQTEKLYSGHCEHCGWNPEVKSKRLEQMYGAKKARSACEYSRHISEGTNAEYNRKWKNYRPRKEEPDD